MLKQLPHMSIRLYLQKLHQLNILVQLNVYNRMSHQDICLSITSVYPMYTAMLDM